MINPTTVIHVTEFIMISLSFHRIKQDHAFKWHCYLSHQTYFGLNFRTVIVFPSIGKSTVHCNDERAQQSLNINEKEERILSRNIFKVVAICIWIKVCFILTLHLYLSLYQLLLCYSVSRSIISRKKYKKPKFLTLYTNILEYNVPIMTITWLNFYSSKHANCLPNFFSYVIHSQFLYSSCICHSNGNTAFL